MSVYFTLLKTIRTLSCNARRKTACQPSVTFIQCYCTQDDKMDSHDSAQIEKKRNISGLPSKLRSRMTHVDQLPKSVFRTPYKNIKVERDELRKAYATFGERSGIKPGIMWDTKEEYHEHLAQDLMRPSLEEAVRNAVRAEKLKAQDKANVIANVRVRVEELMPELMRAHREKRQKAIQKRTVKKVSRIDELLIQAQEYLGYAIQRSDPEFMALKEKMKEEQKLQKKLEKKAKKKARQTLMKPGGVAKEQSTSSEETASKVEAGSKA